MPGITQLDKTYAPTMNFIQVNSSTIRPGKMSDLQEWLQTNGEALADAMPEGNDWLGCYVAVQTTEKGMGTLFWMIRQDSYGASDGLAAAGEPFRSLISEFDDFLDPETTNWGSILLKDVADITIWGGEE